MVSHSGEHSGEHHMSIRMPCDSSAIHRFTGGKFAKERGPSQYQHTVLSGLDCVGTVYSHVYNRESVYKTLLRTAGP